MPTSTYPVHPGSILGEELKARGILQKDFAAQIGMQASHLSAIITGNRNITPAIADKIAMGLSDIPASFWVSAQEKYQESLKKARINPSLLVSGYQNRATENPATLEEPGVGYSISLGPHFENFIQSSIFSGRYSNASEVIRSGLRLLEEQEQKIAALRSAIEEGLASGLVEDFDPDAFLQQMKNQKHGKL